MKQHRNKTHHLLKFPKFLCVQKVLGCNSPGMHLCLNITGVKNSRKLIYVGDLEENEGLEVCSQLL
jgi:hypothetical protein